MAASQSKLSQLHEKLAEAFSEALDGQPIIDTDPDTGEVKEIGRMAPSAAILAAASNFLKANNISSAPAAGSALDEVRQKMEDRAARRQQRRIDHHDLNLAKEDMVFLEGLPKQ